MNWVTIIWSATSGACATIAFMYLLVWFSDRRSWAHLCFVVTVLGVLGLAACEFVTMATDSPEVFGRAIRWTHLVYAIGLIGSMGFIHFYFGTDRRWLLALAVGLRVIVQVPNFTTGLNLHLIAIHNLKKIDFLGQQVSVLGDATPNPWMNLGWLAFIAQLAYIVDASLRLWRTGLPSSRKRAALVGGALAFILIFVTVNAGLVARGVLHLPFITSVPFLAMALVMGYELSHDVLRAAQLGRELHESTQQMTLAAEATNLGFWTWGLVRNEFWATAKCRALLGFSSSDSLSFDRFLQHLHPADRAAAEQALAPDAQGGNRETEFRVLRTDGAVKWIVSRSQFESDASGKPVMGRGVFVDITTRKHAEEAARNLSGRLINAQEEERKRLARELHDDLSQSLAMLAVDLELAGLKPPSNPGQLNTRMRELSAQVRGLSSAVHQLSHDLHPAKLEQLGLAAALRGFCREVSAAHQVAVTCNADDLPRVLPDEVVLCLYRVAQEALQNVVKHSAATNARVSLTATANEIRLEVVDDGTGFDAQAESGDKSLGLVSMRERVRLVRGQLNLTTAKGEGTRIEVRVPLAGAPAQGPNLGS